ncbi:MAG TPA: bifunctional diaminohydroxyphosphoribosylaminopyrimidine deaminase/5-amino-6-(5-phosphoribosylamino)uracil reductase RibD [Ectothiorhodospiraceae bacterium]|nr:bifunctional diaminohydroxyphosphoribosylaminopyrimidine deaminase/5-amino-6-(5-phosphoribosylamino)uracil reductase RibD [Ectothiorhodospiraceae bacterium]
MVRALQLAERGLFTTHPNPRVGCVIVNGEEVIGEGWHQKAGGPHAEIHALQQAGENARGATAYVTLEPCSHHGKTPPCADALIAAGISRVVIAMQDPNPQVAGAGIERLRKSGIEVSAGLLEADARALNPGFILRMSEGRPFVRCKMAISLDGRTAMASGESQWITGADAREDGQRLRARSSAIMTGVGTVLADDPQMTVRLEGEAVKTPLRIVLDPHLSTPISAKILQGDAPTLIVTAVDEPGIQQQFEEAGIEVIAVPGCNDTIDLPALMQILANREINEIHLEAGATLSGAMLHEGLIDELNIYMAAKLMGSGARALFNTPGLELLADAVDLDIIDIRAVGADWRIRAKVNKG